MCVYECACICVCMSMRVCVQYAENYRRCMKIYNRIRKLSISPIGQISYLSTGSVALYNGIAHFDSK